MLAIAYASRTCQSVACGLLRGKSGKLGGLTTEASVPVLEAGAICDIFSICTAADAICTGPSQMSSKVPSKIALRAA